MGWASDIDYMKIVRLVFVVVGLVGAYLLGQKSGKVGMRPDVCDEDDKVMYRSAESYADYYAYGDYAPEDKDKKPSPKPKDNNKPDVTIENVNVNIGGGAKKGGGGGKKLTDGWVCPKVTGAGIFGLPSLGKYWWAYLMLLIGFVTQFSFTCAGGLFGAPAKFEQCFKAVKNLR